MKDRHKTKKQHMDELAELLRQVVESEKAGIEDKHLKNKLQEIKNNLEIWVKNRTAGLESEIKLLKDEIAGHKKAKEALRKSEAFMTAIVAAFDGFIYICSNDYRIEFMNDLLIMQTGYDATGELCYKALQKRGSVCPWCPNERVFNGELVHLETVNPTDRGWYYVVSSPLYNPDGTVSKQSLMFNITDKKKKEDERRKFKFICDNSNDSLVILDREARFLYVNKNLCETLGYSENELLKKRFPDVHPNWDKEKYHNLFDIVQNEKVVPFEILCNKKDGYTIPIEVSATGYQTDGKPYGFAVLRDITERKKIEEALLKGQDILEVRINERTSELVKTNKELLEEISNRKKIEEDLSRTEKKLRIHAKELVEGNIALKVLLRQRENDKKELEDNILSNIKQLILPYLAKLKKNRPLSDEFAYLNIIESNLKEIISPFSQKLSSMYLGLTPKEIQIADLIKDGKQDKDIMEILKISFDTVKSHRKNIRKKLGIYGQRINMRTKLLSINE
jgi:PAS domain S-box-containing protein